MGNRITKVAVEVNTASALKSTKALDVGLAALLTTIASLTSGNDDLAKVNKTLASTLAKTTKDTKAATKADTELEKIQKKLDAAYNDEVIALQKVRAQLNETNSQNKLAIQLNQAKEGSYQELSAQYSINIKALKKMSAEELATAKASGGLVESTAALREEMSSFQQQLGNNSLEVGKYEAGFLGAMDKMEASSSGTFKGMIGGIKTVGVAFMANPIGLIITAIVAAFTALVAVFKQTEKGSEFFADMGGMISGAFQGVIGIVDKVTSAISNLGSALVKLVKGDFKGMRESFKAVGESVSGLGSDFVDSVKSGKELVEVERENVKANRELERSLIAMRAEEEKLSILRDDDTRGFRERTAAAEEHSKAIIRIAAVEKQIASNNLKLANDALALRTKNGAESQALMDDQLAAQQAFDAASNDLSNKQLQNAQVNAKLEQDMQEKSIDIIRDGWATQQTINLARVADENKTFEERSALLLKTSELSKKTFDAEIALIQTNTTEQINANDLLMESNAIVLEQRIRDLELSEIMEQQLLTSIRDRKTGLQDIADTEIELLEEINDARLEAAKIQKETSDQQVVIVKETAQEVSKWGEWQMKQQKKWDEMTLADKVQMGIQSGQVTANALNQIANMMDVTSKAEFEKQKKFKIAAATVDMLTGAVQAYMGFQSLPLGIGIPLGIAAAATVVAAGAMQIDQIEKTTFESPSSTPAAMPSTAPSIPATIPETPSLPSPTAPNTAAPAFNPTLPNVSTDLQQGGDVTHINNETVVLEPMVVSSEVYRQGEYAKEVQRTMVNF